MKKVMSLVLCLVAAMFFVSCASNSMVVMTAPCEEPAPAPPEPKVIKVTENVMFDWDSDVIRDDQKPVLDDIAGYLVDYPDTLLVIEGYASEEGATDYNLDLSNRRAESVRAGLHERGVAPASIKSVVGNGETTTFGDILKDNRRVLVITVD
jgi:outer membrane protein OmpA-like peptidoglycan-associated protein